MFDDVNYQTLDLIIIVIAIGSIMIVAIDISYATVSYFDCADAMMKMMMNRMMKITFIFIATAVAIIIILKSNTIAAVVVVVVATA